MTKKKLSRDQKRKQKKQKRATKQSPSPADYSPMIRRLQEAGLGEHKLVYNPPHVPKMSQVLLEFIEPYKEYAPTTEAMHQLITTALVAWNTALLPEAEREQHLQEMSKLLPAELVEDFYAIVGEMIERKNTFFAHYTRRILDYQLTETEGQHHISVISTTDLETPDEQQ